MKGCLAAFAFCLISAILSGQSDAFDWKKALDGLRVLGGLRDNGEFDRGGGKMVTFSYKETMRFEKYLPRLKYHGICFDKTTGIFAQSLTNGRTGNVDKCLEELFQKLARKGEL
ncbi:uncharacterized protein [Clytia hemisphaerica]|uniref:Uncharacterized protein n=1 Tax=Clytia hemisphaerica TaxID=252671 RepID=A0A7M5WIU8_9CNID